MKTLVLDYIAFAFLFTFALGFFDTLWIFGIEDSQQYTWWAYMQYFGK